MAVQSYSIKLESINIYKFKSLTSGLPLFPDKMNSLNILPQVREVSIFESIFSSILRCEIAVVDYIGLFTNFPLSGEEIIVIEYRDIDSDIIKKWYFSTEEITDITPDPKNRAVGFVIKGVSIEALANNLGTVQQAYEGTTTKIIQQIFEDHINQRIKQFFPSYPQPNMLVYDGETQPYTFVVPNLHPISAITAVQELSVSITQDFYTYLFFQNRNGFNFTTIQQLITGTNKRREAKRNNYKFFSNEISEEQSRMHNQERIVSNLSFNKRFSSMERLSLGYFNNNFFEINLAQKAIHQTPTNIDDFRGITNNHINSESFEQWAKLYYGGEDEMSNRTKYVVTSQRENDQYFPVSRMRDRWGKDIISKIAMSQIDITVVIPGTNKFVAGDLFYLELPEIHGFNDVKDDDLLHGYFLISEIKHVINLGGYQTTVMRLNKDTLNDSIDRGSRY